MEAKYVLQEYNFSQCFAVPKFEAVETESDLNRQGKPKKYTTTGKPIHITTPREKGCVNNVFQKESTNCLLHQRHGKSQMLLSPSVMVMVRNEEPRMRLASRF